MVTNSTEAKQKRKLCFVVSAPLTASVFLNGHIDHLVDQFDITVVCKFDGSELQISQNANVKHIKINRAISPLTDVLAIWRLHRFLRRENFEIVHSVSPKAGLITAISGWLARVPIRIHWFTGQVWVLSKGMKRRLLKNLDKLIANLNTHVLVDSSSQRQFLINQGVVTAHESQVLGSGSIAGVDTSRFKPNPTARTSVRNELGIRDVTAKIIIFVGRLTRDKGIDILLEVFLSGKLHQDPFLVLVGPDEGHYLHKIDKFDEDRRNRLRYIPYTQEPEHFLAAADIFCLPTFREGFGLSIIEASAVGLPIVASNIYGVTDAMEDQVTGMLISPGDSDELAIALNGLLSNPEELRRMGTLGRTRVLRDWQDHRLQTDLQRFYQDQIGSLTRTEYA